MPHAIVSRKRRAFALPALAAFLLSLVGSGIAPSAPAGAQAATTYPTPINANLVADTYYFVVLSTSDGILEAEVAGTTGTFGYPDADDCALRLGTTTDECYTSVEDEGNVTAIGFTGSGTQVRAALASLTFTPYAGVVLSAAKLNAEIVINPGGPDRIMYFNPENGHYYEWVVGGEGESEDEDIDPDAIGPAADDPVTYTWLEAFAAARTLSITVGSNVYVGYLATITSESEQEFAFEYVSATSVWIGATDDYEVLNSIIADIRAKNGNNAYGPYTGQFKATPVVGVDLMAEGRWYWVSGPEAGTLFGTGCDTGWANASGQVSFWDDGEPNNFPSCTGGDEDVEFGEHYAVLNVSRGDPYENWNDYPVDIENNGFLAEFGPLDGGPAAAFTLDQEFTIVSLIPSAATAAPPVLVCTPDPVAPGALVTCQITGGNPGIDILWRASFNGTFAEAGVTLDDEGRGTFTFIAPRSAAGQSLSVVLVEWTDPVTVRVLSQALPGTLPAGEGSGGVPMLPLLLAGGLLAAAVWRLRSGTASQLG